MIFQNGSMEKMLYHAKTEYPKECCGIILGTCNGDEKTADVVIYTENIAEKKRQNTSFLISPKAVIDAELSASKKGLEIVGFYHSHPDYDAILSKEDEKYMITGYSYPIISIKNGVCVEINSYEKKCGEGEKNADYSIHISYTENFCKS